MAGADDGASKGGAPRSGYRRRSSLRRAEPTPLTEAMITPRSGHGVPEEDPDGGPRFCHSCGERNPSGGSYCLSCGVRFRWRDDRPGSEVSTGRDGTLRPPEEREGGAIPFSSTEPEGAGSGIDEESAPVPRRAIRTLALSALVLASLTVGFLTLAGRDSQPDAPPPEPPPSSTTPSTVDVLTLRSYADEISVLGADVTEAAATGSRINDEWDERITDYETAKERMGALVSRTSLLPGRLGEVVLPGAANPILHRRMIQAISAFASAAERMMLGLESTDTGETRLSELLRFEAAASEFRTFVDELERSL